MHVAFWSHLTKDPWELLKNIAAVLGGLVALAAVIGALFKAWDWTRPRWREWRDRKTLKKRMGAEQYDAQEILRATTAYIHPDCQSVDPAGGEDFRRVVSTREPLFNATDRLLENPSEYKFVILLADSGMGKTSFLLNYYARHWRSRRRGRFQLQLIPLNLKNTDQLIGRIPENGRRETVLCLDALDEDPQAIRDHRQRLSELIALTRDFRTVVITCRSQFFPKEEEIPTETGVLKVGPVSAGEPRALYFHKLYLSPLTDDQVNAYLKRRFPLRKWRLRRMAREVIRKIPDLVARPMILAHAQDLVGTDHKLDHRFQVYEEMVGAWLEREKGLVQSKDALCEFSERLAVDLFANRSARGMERIAEVDLKPLADQYGIRLEGWQLRGRSLLNRDAVGNYKFAHRSIMEYLVTKSFVSGKAPKQGEPWTDLMKTFLVEMVKCHLRSGLAGADLSRMDLHGDDLSGANLGWVDLTGADLDGARLRDADLTGAHLSGADLSRAHGRWFRDLSRRDFRRTSFTRADLRVADLSWADFEGALLNEADLTGALLTRTGLVSADLSRADLSRADLTGAQLQKANLTGTELSGANLRGADLNGADLSGADVRGALRLTREQISLAVTDEITKLDDNLRS